MQAAELYFVGGALALYLLDASLLLYGDELVFARARGGWRNLAVSESLVFRRRVLLPNPLTPYVPLRRVCWSDQDSGTAQPQPDAARDFLRALRPLQIGVVILLLLIAVALPAVLLAYGQGLPLLMLLALVYALNLGMAIWLWRQRAALGLAVRSCTILTVDLLACPPFAINLVRKITMQQPLPGDPLLFARERFSAEGFSALCALLARRVQCELAAEQPDGPHYRQLEALHHRLMELDS